MKRLFTSIAAVLITIAALAADDYARYAKRATLFYDNQEWASASAMYNQMIALRPSVGSNYSRAIVTAVLEGNRPRQQELLQESMRAHVPLDTVFTGVRQLSFQLGEAWIYEQFLEDVSATIPWMKRNIDARLLDYYRWRRNGEGMVEYATRMLTGLPDDLHYLTALADGYFLLGNDREAIDTYRRIIALDPDDYHALLVLGNYYGQQSRLNRFDKESPLLARQYLGRAQRLRPTPYVATLLNKL